MSRLADLRVSELLAAVGERTPAPASGAAAALTGALGAALAELAARYAGDEASAGRARRLVTRLVELADEDSAAYAAFLADRSDETRRRTIEVPIEVAERAEEAAGLASEIRSQLVSAVAADAEAAERLARVAAGVARRLAEVNAESGPAGGRTGV
jgi:formiminotetrahydrofolate cyclodeaminase